MDPVVNDISIHIPINTIEGGVRAHWMEAEMYFSAVSLA